jgi:hypothetical protein
MGKNTDEWRPKEGKKETETDRRTEGVVNDWRRKPTLWSTLFLEKLIFAYLVKKFPALPCTHQPAIDPYPEPDESSPLHPII